MKRTRTSKGRDEARDYTMGEGPDISTRLSRIERMLMELLKRSGEDRKLEIEQMADFTALNAQVAKMTDLAASFKTMTDALKTQRDAAVAELATLKAADAVDQDAVDAAQAKLAEVNAALEAVTAVAANTPVDVGGSTGGVVS